MLGFWTLNVPVTSVVDSKQDKQKMRRGHGGGQWVHRNPTSLVYCLSHQWHCVSGSATTFVVDSKKYKLETPSERDGGCHVYQKFLFESLPHHSQFDKLRRAEDSKLWSHKNNNVFPPPRIISSQSSFW
jgi:hypothetical protein